VLTTLNISAARVIAALLLAAVSLLAPWWIVKGLRRRSQVDALLLGGAISVFLLVGMAFSMAYTITAVTQHSQMLWAPGPVLEDGVYRDHVYFSFVTLSTTGYGDLSPASGTARALAVVEALGGQLYLVVGLASIVSLLVQRGRRANVE
jgi:hypothetical protein